MTTTTEILGLFKYDTLLDAELPFNIDEALNGNWDIIDSSIPTKTSQLTNDSGFLTQHQDLSDYVKKSTSNSISGATTFTGVTKVPNSAAVGTAVSTAAISKAANGYVKFGNGIIIQWGHWACSKEGGTGTVTLPTSFSGTNYGITTTHVRGDVGDRCYPIFTKITKSNFNWKADSSSTNYWIAIGY